MTATSTHRVNRHRARRRDRRAVFRVELNVDQLHSLLESVGHLEGSDRLNNEFVRDAYQIFMDELLTYGPAVALKRVTLPS